MESVLQRGEKLDDLVDRSQALSMQSKMFYKTAKKVCVPDLRMPFVTDIMRTSKTPAAQSCKALGYAPRLS